MNTQKNTSSSSAETHVVKSKCFQQLSSGMLQLAPTQLVLVSEIPLMYVTESMQSEECQLVKNV